VAPVDHNVLTIMFLYVSFSVMQILSVVIRKIML